MNNNAKIIQLRQHVAANLAEIDRLASMPEDDFEEGAVIVFNKVFHRSGHPYSYASLKCRGQWYTTARNSGPFTWDDMFAFLSSGVDEVWLATELVLQEDLLP